MSREFIDEISDDDRKQILFVKKLEVIQSIFARCIYANSIGQPPNLIQSTTSLEEYLSAYLRKLLVPTMEHVMNNLIATFQQEINASDLSLTTQLANEISTYLTSGETLRRSSLVMRYRIKDF